MLSRAICLLFRQFRLHVPRYIIIPYIRKSAALQVHCRSSPHLFPPWTEQKDVVIQQLLTKEARKSPARAVGTLTVFCVYGTAVGYEHTTVQTPWYFSMDTIPGSFCSVSV